MAKNDREDERLKRQVALSSLNLPSSLLVSPSLL
jgi:hypothetical protein